MTKLIIDFQNLREELPAEYSQNLMELAKKAKGYLFIVVLEDGIRSQTFCMNAMEAATAITGILENYPEATTLVNLARLMKHMGR